jgi:hypothetical protein
VSTKLGSVLVVLVVLLVLDVLDLAVTALALLGQGVEVVPVESPEYMYSTSSWPFEPVAP